VRDNPTLIGTVPGQNTEVQALWKGAVTVSASVAPVEFPVATVLMIRDVADPDFRLADLVQASQDVITRLDM
jgi:hypothetical protein